MLADGLSPTSFVFSDVNRLEDYASIRGKDVLPKSISEQIQPSRIAVGRQPETRDDLQRGRKAFSISDIARRRMKLRTVRPAASRKMPIGSYDRIKFIYSCSFERSSLIVVTGCSNNGRTTKLERLLVALFRIRSCDERKLQSFREDQWHSND